MTGIQVFFPNNLNCDVFDIIAFPFKFIGNECKIQ